MGSAVRQVKTIVPRRRVPPAPEPPKPAPIPFIQEAISVVLGMFAIFLCLALFSAFFGEPAKGSTVSRALAERPNMMGPTGQMAAAGLITLLGWCSFVISLWAVFLARSVWTATWDEDTELNFSDPLKSFAAAVLFTIATAAIAATWFGYKGGGYLGSAFAFRMIAYVGEAGTVLICGGLLLLCLGSATGLRTKRVVNSSAVVGRKAGGLMKRGSADILSLWWRAVKMFARGQTSIGRFVLRSAGAFFRSIQRVFLGPAYVANHDAEIEVNDLNEPEFPDHRISAPAPVLKRKNAAQARMESRQNGAFELGITPELDDLAYELAPTEEKQESTSRFRRSRKSARQLAADDKVEEEDVEEDGEAEEEYEDDEDEDDDEIEFDEEDEEFDDEDSEEKAEAEPAPRRRGKKDVVPAKQSLRESKEIVVTRHVLANPTVPLLQDDSDEDHPGTFRLPPLDLLGKGPDSAALADAIGAPERGELLKNSKRLEQALSDFRIGGRIIEVHPGPVITLYEFEPAAGVKVQRVITLADDLALALKVASVRVYAPVVGKGTVGIEVPNSVREIVRLRDIVASDEYQRAKQPLMLALGKDTFGEPFSADLAAMPHLLIAGATGTGKSVSINALITSLLYRNSPDDLQMIMIDPKMLELSVYEDIPHLKSPVVTNPKHARGVLWWAVEEMERRYGIMKSLGVRDLNGYNQAVLSGQAEKRAKRLMRRGEEGTESSVIELSERDIVATSTDHSAHLSSNSGAAAFSRYAASGAGTGNLKTLPRIVIIVDELADLMLTVGREIEELLTRLAQKARASGIHLILATQRPSVNVITGLIKANFPARLSFKVASRIDARTVLDTSGSEKLLGQGDMLFLSPGLGRLKRLHGAYVSDQEVHEVVDWLRDQGPPRYDESIQKMITRLDEEGEGGENGIEEFEMDELYDRAVQFVVDRGQASTSLVQRAFRIGYNRAARILDVMERQGVVGPADGAKPRQVLIAAGDDL